MKIFKRVSLLMIALLLVLSTLTIGVTAEGETGTMSVTITADKSANLYPGEIITFTINVTNNYYCTGMRWPVMFSSKALEIVTVDDNVGNVQAYGAVGAAGSDLSASEATGGSNVHAGIYNKNNYGCLLIQWLAQTNNGNVNYYREESGSNCITFQLRVKEAPTVTSATIIIPTNSTTYKNLFYYQAIANPADATSFYKMDSSSLTVTTTPATVTCFTEAAAIRTKVNTDTVIDAEHGYIYGLTKPVSESASLATADDFANYVTAVGGATFTVTPNSLNMCSTGAVVRAYDAANVLIGTYTVVVFGDVNGDGIIEATDMNMVLGASTYEYEFSWDGSIWDNPQFLACDTDANGIVTADDYDPVVKAAQSIGYIEQTRDTANTFINY